MIQFDAVHKRFPNGTTAVHDLSLEMPEGGVTVLVGSSGCGKTTTLRMVNRMVEPTSGTIRVGGKDVTRQDAAELRRSIGYVIQQSGLFPHRTVLDNIATVPLLLGWGRRKARARAAELLETVGLAADAGKRYPHQLSGGQQQRVGVARALAADPPVLLMDEPFGAVDPVVRTQLQDELLRLQKELSKTIVFVTHDVDEAVRLGDRRRLVTALSQKIHTCHSRPTGETPGEAVVSPWSGAGEGPAPHHPNSGDSMQYVNGIRKAAPAIAALLAALSVTACQADGSKAAAETSSKAPSSAPSASTTTPGTTSQVPSHAPTSKAPTAKASPISGSGSTGTAVKTCAATALKVTAHQATDRPAGTGTGAAVVVFTNVSAKPCILQGHPTVAGAGNGSPEHNAPLKVTPSGSAAPVKLAPGAKAWLKLTFVQVQGEADGYCKSGAKPVAYPTLVVGLPGSGAHQVALDDGVFAECDNTVTATAVAAA